MEEKSKWDRFTVAELLDAIGQDRMQVKDDLTGISHGDFGKVDFFTLNDNEELRLVFDSPEDAENGFNAMSNQLTNPYEFGNRFDQMPCVVMVTFTEN